MAAGKEVSLKSYRSGMCPKCRDYVRLLTALTRLEDTQYELKKAERESIKQMKEVNKRNPNPHADAKEKLAFAMARVPQVFQQVEDLKRKYMDMHRNLSDIKIDIKCLNKFAPTCSPADCRGLDGFAWTPAKSAAAKKAAEKAETAKTKKETVAKKTQTKKAAAAKAKKPTDDDKTIVAPKKTAAKKAPVKKAAAEKKEPAKTAVKKAALAKKAPAKETTAKKATPDKKPTAAPKPAAAKKTGAEKKAAPTIKKTAAKKPAAKKTTAK